MGKKFASLKRAIGDCDRCGQQYKLKKLKKETVKGIIINLKVCPTCWDLDHPQLMLGKYPVEDAQAIEDPRSDSAELALSRALLDKSGAALAGSVEDYLEANL